MATGGHRCQRRDSISAIISAGGQELEGKENHDGGRANCWVAEAQVLDGQVAGTTPTLDQYAVVACSFRGNTCDL